MFFSPRGNSFLSSSSSDDDVDSLFGSSAPSSRPPKSIDGTHSSFILGDKLGEGSYATVKEGIDQATLRIVAVKIFDLRRLRHVRNNMQNIKREVRIQRRLRRHRNLIELIDVIHKEGKPKMYIILEMATGCTVERILEESVDNKLVESQVANIAFQTLNGLQYMHGRGVVHRDIKPANLMLNFDGTLKISDFGVAEFLNEYVADDNVSRTSGSPVFQAPEIARGDHDYSGTKVDVWALGVTVYMLLSGRIPFKGDSLVDLFQNISTGRFKMLDDVSPECQDAISKFLTTSWHDRPSVDEMLTHPWILQGDVELSDVMKAERGWIPVPKKKFGIMEVVKRMYSADDDVQSNGPTHRAGNGFSPFPSASFPSAPFQGTSFPDSSFSNASFPNQSVSDKSFPDHSFPNHSSRDTSFNGTSLPQTLFPDTSHSEKKFPETSISGASLTGGLFPQKSFPTSPFPSSSPPSLPQSPPSPPSSSASHAPPPSSLPVTEEPIPERPSIPPTISTDGSTELAAADQERSCSLM